MTLLIEYGALLRGYGALLRGYGALLRGYGALLIDYSTVYLMQYSALMNNTDLSARTACCSHGVGLPGS